MEEVPRRVEGGGGTCGTGKGPGDANNRKKKRSHQKKKENGGREGVHQKQGGPFHAGTKPKRGKDALYIGGGGGKN